MDWPPKHRTCTDPSLVCRLLQAGASALEAAATLISAGQRARWKEELQAVRDRTSKCTSACFPAYDIQPDGLEEWQGPHSRLSDLAFLVDFERGELPCLMLFFRTDKSGFDQRTGPPKMRNSPFLLHPFPYPQSCKIRITGKSQANHRLTGGSAF